MKRDNKKEVMNALIMVFQFGINMIVPIFLCTLAGVWIGKKTGADWVTVPLFFIGAFAGANNIYRMVQKFLKSEDDAEPSDRYRAGRVLRKQRYQTVLAG